MANILKFPVPVDYRELLRRLGEAEGVAHVVVVVEREDGMSEVWYDRQPSHSIAFASAVLANVSSNLVAASIDEG